MTTTKTIRIVVVAACFVVAALFSGCAGRAPHKVYAQRVNSSDVAERRAAVSELRAKRIDSKMVPILLQATRDRDAQVRTYAFYALGRADPREEGVVPAVTVGMTDSVGDVRRAVVAALNEFDPFPTACIPYMIKMLADPDDGVRRHITMAFIALEGTGVISLVRQIDSRDRNLRMAIINVLGEIGPPARGSLAKLKSIAQQDEDEEIKKAAEIAAGRIER